MKSSTRPLALLLGFALSGTSLVRAADDAQLDVLALKEVPTGLYDVQLQLDGEIRTLRLAIKGGRAAFVKSDTAKLEGLSGRFQLIGNGVFLALLAGADYQASQLWVMHADGTATVKEIPDRGENQTAKPAPEKE